MADLSTADNKTLLENIVREVRVTFYLQLKLWLIDHSSIMPEAKVKGWIFAQKLTDILKLRSWLSFKTNKDIYLLCPQKNYKKDPVREKKKV